MGRPPPREKAKRRPGSRTLVKEEEEEAEEEEGKGANGAAGKAEEERASLSSPTSSWIRDPKSGLNSGTGPPRFPETGKLSLPSSAARRSSSIITAANPVTMTNGA